MHEPAGLRVERAPNGSSISRISGSTASVRAMATRCFMPPESCEGKLSSNPLNHQLDEILGAPLALGLGDAELFEPVEDVLPDRLPRKEGEVLEQTSAGCPLSIVLHARNDLFR